MLVVTVLSVLIAGVLGLIAKFVFTAFRSEDFYGEPREISWPEFSIVFVLMASVIAPVVSNVGNSLSIDNIVTYTQLVNGVETAANDSVTTCYAGHAGNSKSSGQSNCDHTYVSGRYMWSWTEIVQDCTTDSKGNQKCTSRPVVHYEWDNIYTPYATREHAYSIDSSMGGGGNMSFRFPGAYLDQDPVPFDRSVAVPEDLPRGAPADWADAKHRLDAGDPRAVTKLSDYKNYILASDDEVLKTYGARLEQYLAQGLLPDHTANINADPIVGPSRSQADKVRFVGVEVGDTSAWQRAVMRLNAALGMKLQGDLHVVLVDTDVVTMNDSVAYTQSLKAFWQSETFGKRAIAKNAIILVLGVDTQMNVIDWANADTGMPFGNEGMIQWMRDSLPGEPLQPDAIFGSPKTVIKHGVAPDKFTSEDFTVTLASPRGIVEEIVFEKAPFKRARMSCDDGTCVGYKDLLSKIEPTMNQKIMIVVVTELIALGLWLIVGFTGLVGQILPSRRTRTTSHRQFYHTRY